MTAMAFTFGNIGTLDGEGPRRLEWFFHPNLVLRKGSINSVKKEEPLTNNIRLVRVIGLEVRNILIVGSNVLFSVSGSIQSLFPDFNQKNSSSNRPECFHLPSVPYNTPHVDI